jgi:NifU-like protein involved in Fe-S cluster formation
MKRRLRRWQNVGFAGKMVKGKTLEETEKITEKDVINFLGGIPKPKIHCTCIVKRTLQKAIKYRDSECNTHNNKV